MTSAGQDLTALSAPARTIAVLMVSATPLAPNASVTISGWVALANVAHASPIAQEWASA